jgi:Fungal specific transcription factor domain
VELSGFYSSSFWEKLILQASTTEPALRHAVISIGALHEEYNNGTLKYDIDSTAPAFAVSQYTKAIGHLRKCLANGKQAPLTALMSCILFVCFDSLRGFFTSAMIHLHSGLKILRDLRFESAAENHIIEEDLAPLFNRLSLQSVLYVDTRTAEIRRDFVAQLSYIRSKDEEVPEAFETLEDARTSLNQAADGLFRVFYLCDGKDFLVTRVHNLAHERTQGSCPSVNNPLSLTQCSTNTTPRSRRGTLPLRSS